MFYISRYINEAMQNFMVLTFDSPVNIAMIEIQLKRSRGFDVKCFDDMAGTSVIYSGFVSITILKAL